MLTAEQMDGLELITAMEEMYGILTEPIHAIMQEQLLQHAVILTQRS
jgi:hypothetical protein